MSTPTRIAVDLGRIIDIAATHYSHISACETHTKVYMFGQCRGQGTVLSKYLVYINLQ